MLQWHTKAGWSHRAYWGENAIDWGKDGTPERLRDRQSAGDRQVGAAGGAGRPASSCAGDRDRRLGVHPARGHGLLGQGRHHDPDPAGWSALRLAHGLGRGPAAASAARGCRRTSRRSSGTIDRKWTEAQTKELRDYFVEHAYAKTKAVAAPLRPKLAEAEEKRKADRAADPHDAGLPRAGRRAQAGVSCSSGASTTSGARRWAGACRRSCRRCRRASRSTAWDWPGGWSRPITR